MGIIEASGEYIVFLDSDEILLEDSIYKRIKVFEEKSNVDMVYGDMIIDGKHIPFDKIQDYDQKNF